MGFVFPALIYVQFLFTQLVLLLVSSVFAFCTPQLPLLVVFQEMNLQFPFDRTPTMQYAPCLPAPHPQIQPTAEQKRLGKTKNSRGFQKGKLKFALQLFTSHLHGISNYLHNIHCIRYYKYSRDDLKCTGRCACVICKYCAILY